MVIGLGYEFGPNIIGIQEGYNKNFHIKCIEYDEKFDFVHIVLRCRDGNMWEVLVDDCGLVRILVLRIVIPEACMYDLSL